MGTKGKSLPKKRPAPRLIRCHASRGDGECFWEKCPQIRDGEPEKSGRHCPLDLIDWDDG